MKLNTIRCAVVAFLLSSGGAVANEIHYLSVEGDGVLMAMQGASDQQIYIDTENCGQSSVFKLLSSHANYDALSGALLTYYFAGREDVTITVSGCSGDKPVIVGIDADS